LSNPFEIESNTSQIIKTTQWLNVNSHRFTPWNNSFAIQRSEPVDKRMKDISITPTGFNKSK